MSAKFEFVQLGRLHANCVLEGADQFVRVETKAWLDVDELKSRQSELFDTISRDFERGYHATTSFVPVRVAQCFMHHLKADWEMSYFGKAEIKLFVRHVERSRRLIQEVRGLVALMQTQVVIENMGMFVTARADVSMSRKTIRGRDRAVPVINHQFQQLRPLLLTVLEEQKEARRDVCRMWAARPVIPLDWSR